jgi:hypothetical protein
MRQVLALKRDCTACNTKRLEAVYTLLFEDLIIMFGKRVQRLVEPEHLSSATLAAVSKAMLYCWAKLLMMVMIGLRLLKNRRSFLSSLHLTSHCRSRVNYREQAHHTIRSKNQ